MTFNVIVAPDSEAQQDAAQRLKQWLAASSATIREHLERLRDYVELRVDISLDEVHATATLEDLVHMRQESETRPAVCNGSTENG